MALEGKSIPSVKIGIIGAGRVGSALAWCLDAHGCRVHAAASKNADEVLLLARRIKSCSVLTAQGVADECDLIFVTTPDGLIQAAADAVDWRTDTGVVHCSGATDISALSKAELDGAMIGGFHPMQAFGDAETAARMLPGCVVTIEASGLLNHLLIELALRLSCPVNQLPPGARASYHAAAGYASQYINVLVSEAIHIWKSWGATEEAALQALLPAIRGQVSAIQTAGVAKGMPGPVSRGDLVTVQKHLAALAAIDGGTVSLYRELCLRSVPLALEAKVIGSQQAEAIRQVLTD